MSYNGSGTFVINSTGQPVVTGTVISSTAFNALTADLATGLSTAITKDGQTTTTVRVPFAQGISSTLVTDATSATTGSIITAGGISTQKALWVGTTSRLVGNTQHDGLVGIGMTPTNILDITQNQNATSTVSILNSNASTAAFSRFYTSNGTNFTYMGTFGTGYTTSSALQANRGFIGTSDTLVVCAATNQIIFASGGIAEVARFDASGNLLVGTTNTGAAVPSGFALNANSTAAYMGIGHPSGSPSGTTYLNFYYNAGQIGSVSQNGTTGVLYNLTSDQRLKRWHTDQRDFRSMILGVVVGDVEWNSAPGSRMLAIMAQQTNEFYPDAITPGKTDADMWQADYGRLAPLALWGVKDLYAENEALKASIADLTTRLAALENK